MLPRGLSRAPNASRKRNGQHPCRNRRHLANLVAAYDQVSRQDPMNDVAL